MLRHAFAESMPRPSACAPAIPSHGWTEPPHDNGPREATRQAAACGSGRPAVVRYEPPRAPGRAPATARRAGVGPPAAALRAPRIEPAGTGPERHYPLLPGPEPPELQRGHRVLPARVVHDEVQPQN